MTCIEKNNYIYLYLNIFYIHILLEARVQHSTSKELIPPWNLWTSGDVGEAVPGSAKRFFFRQQNYFPRLIFPGHTPKFEHGTWKMIIKIIGISFSGNCHCQVICEKTSGFGYVFQRRIDTWRVQNPSLQYFRCYVSLPEGIMVGEKGQKA